jgi:hypothetical protein
VLTPILAGPRFFSSVLRSRLRACQRRPRQGSRVRVVATARRADFEKAIPRPRIIVHSVQATAPDRTGASPPHVALRRSRGELAPGSGSSDPSQSRKGHAGFQVTPLPADRQIRGDRKNGLCPGEVQTRKFCGVQSLRLCSAAALSPPKGSGSACRPIWNLIGWCIRQLPLQPLSPDTCTHRRCGLARRALPRSGGAQAWRSRAERQ